MGDGVRVRPLMTSDDWGPVPIIIMAPEAYTPNTPDGAFYEYMLHNEIVFNDEYIQIGVIDKNGEYHDPIDNQDEED